LIDQITTKEDLITVFTKRLKVPNGCSLIVHASLSSLGYVVNGPHDVIEALFEIIGPKGTLLMSSNSSQLTDPAEWSRPSIKQEWVKKVRKHMRPFDKKTTEIRGRGIIPTTFLTYPSVERSSHPVKSIAAKGKLAKHFTETHELHESEGVGSPLHKLYKQKGYSLMIGVDLTSCSILHLAEYLADVPYLYENNFKAYVKLSNGAKEFVRLKKYPVTSKYFYKLRDPLLKKDFLKEISYHQTSVSLLKVQPSVDYLVRILKKDPELLLRP